MFSNNQNNQFKFLMFKIKKVQLFNACDSYVLKDTNTKYITLLFQKNIILNSINLIEQFEI